MIKKIIVFILSLFIFWIIVIKFQIITIDKIVINSNAECAESQEVAQKLNLIGKNLIFLNTDDIKNEILNNYLCIKEVSINYLFPKGLEINLYSRKFLSKIIYYQNASNLSDIESSNSSQSALIDMNFPQIASEEGFVVDDTGFVYGISSSGSLPLIASSEKINLGKKFNQEIFKKISFIIENMKKNTKFSSSPIRYKLNNNIFISDTNPKIIFNLEKDINREVASLQLILQEAKINEDEIKIIDLRFEKPILTFNH